jgi:hypothetical protein
MKTMFLNEPQELYQNKHSRHIHWKRKYDPLKAFYEQDKYFEEILELKKDQNKSFEDVTNP